MADDSRELTLAQCVLIESALADAIKHSNAEAEFAETCDAGAMCRFWTERAIALGEVLILIEDHTMVTVSGNVVRGGSERGPAPDEELSYPAEQLENGEY